MGDALQNHHVPDLRISLIPIKPYNALLATSQCILCRKNSVRTLAPGFGISRKGGTGESGWGHAQAAVHMVAARLNYKRSWLGPGGPPLTLTAWAGLENTTLTL